jgi:hypothetical protein
MDKIGFKKCNTKQKTNKNGKRGGNKTRGKEQI